MHLGSTKSAQLITLEYATSFGGYKSIQDGIFTYRKLDGQVTP